MTGKAKEYVFKLTDTNFKALPKKRKKRKRNRNINIKKKSTNKRPEEQKNTNKTGQIYQTNKIQAN